MMALLSVRLILCRFVHDYILSQDNGDLISTENLEMEKLMHIYWRNFIHNGNPNDNRGFEDRNELEWAPYSDNHSVMKFGYNKFTPLDDQKKTSLATGFQDEVCKFWIDLDIFAKHWTKSVK